MEEGLAEHGLLKTGDELDLAGSEVVAVGERAVDGLLDDAPVLGVGADLVADVLLELVVVDVDVLGPVLLETLDVLGGEGGDEGVDGHGEEDEPALGGVLGLELAVGDDFLVAEEVEAGEQLALVEGVVDRADLPLARGQRPLVVLADVDVVLLLHLAPEHHVEESHFLAGLGDGLPVEVELDAAVAVEGPGLFVLEVQLCEKGALEHIADLVPLLGLDVLAQPGQHQLVDRLPQHQQDGLLPAGYRLVAAPVEALAQHHFVFLLRRPLLPRLHAAHEDHRQERRHAARVHHFARLAVLRREAAQDELGDHWRQLLEERDLLQVQIYEVALVAGPFGLLANAGNRHQLALVVLVHKIDESVLLRQPRRVFLVCALVEVDGLGVGEAVRPAQGLLLAQRRLLGSARVAAFYFAVDYAQKVQGLVHCYKIISTAVAYSLICCRL